MLNLDIQSLNFPITLPLKLHATRRLGCVLTRRGDRIRRVVMRLGDENGPRGGVDKFCRIQVYLNDAAVAVIKEVGPNLYSVIDRATERVGRTVVRHLDQSRIGKQRSRSTAVAPIIHELDTADGLIYIHGERT